MFGYVLLAFILYFIFRLIVGFVLPLWRTTKNVRENINNIKKQSTAPVVNTNSDTEEKIKVFTEKAGDYIDFEEVKE
ncbi:MAG: hypothetical protein PW786_06175 [Arachidicoccus sp.]|nr:hypothetical protein [Arachidicoccus sp.]